MISSTQVPKTFQDLLRPELKGKLAVTTESSSARVIGSMLKYKGDGFMKKLKDQEVKLFKLASLGFLNLLVAGEIAGSAHRFSQPSRGDEGKRRPHRLGAPGRRRWQMPAARPSLPTRPILTLLCCLPTLSLAPKAKSSTGTVQIWRSWKDPFKREYPERGMTTAQYQMRRKNGVSCCVRSPNGERASLTRVSHDEISLTGS